MGKSHDETRIVIDQCVANYNKWGDSFKKLSAIDKNAANAIASELLYQWGVVGPKHEGDPHSHSYTPEVLTKFLLTSCIMGPGSQR